MHIDVLAVALSIAIAAALSPSAAQAADGRSASPLVGARSGAPAALAALLGRVDKVSDKAELTRLLAREIRADVDPFGFGIYDSAGVLGLSVEQSIHGEKTNVAFLLQGGLGLPDREDYLSADPA